MQGNNIHINPNFIHQISGERQCIYVNPSFVKEFNSEIPKQNFRDTATIAENAIYENTIPKGNDKYNPISNVLSKLPVSPLPKLPVMKIGFLANSHIPSSLLKFNGSPSLMCQSNSKYKLNKKEIMRTTFQNKNISSINPGRKKSMKACQKNAYSLVNENAKGNLLRNVPKTKDWSYLKSSEKGDHYSSTNVFKFHQNSDFIENKMVSNFNINNKYVINRIKTVNDIEINNKPKFNYDGKVKVIKTNKDLNKELLKSSILSQEYGNKSLENNDKASNLKYGLQCDDLNAVKVQILPCLRTKTARPLSVTNLPQLMGSPLKLDRRKIKTAYSKYKLVLNTDSSDTRPSCESKTDKSICAKSIINNPENAIFAVKTRSKLIRQKSSNRPRPIQRNFKWLRPNDKNISPNSCKTKQILKPFKKGMLLKAHHKMVLKKLIYQKSYNYGPICSKYKLNNKFIKNSGKRQVINKKYPIGDDSLKQLRSNNCNSEFDMITKYKIKRLPKNVNKYSKIINEDLVSKYKINRKVNGSTKKVSTPQEFVSKNSEFDEKKRKSDKFVNIGGSMYKSTRMSLKKQNIGRNKYYSGTNEQSYLKFRTNKHRHISISSSISKPGALIEIVRRKKLGLTKKRNEFCMFYIKFGKCKKQENGECLFIHDPNKIAMCTRFIRGSCTVLKCPFSHKLDKSKMPVCSHFLKGSCHKEDCLYRHVNVNPKAPVCRNFLKGFCPHGEECKKKHILICEDFQASGKCNLGNNCPLSHRRDKNVLKQSSLKPLKKRRISTSLSTSGKFRSERRFCNKVGVLGLPKSSIPSQTFLKKSSFIPSNRYFESKICKEKGKKTASLKSDLNMDTSKLLLQSKEPTPLPNSVTSNQSKLCDSFEQKRIRLLQKVEKLKSLYSVGIDEGQSALSSSRDKLTSCSEILCSSKVSKIDYGDEIFSDVKLWRVPLPDVLPSYIPLEFPRTVNM